MLEILISKGANINSNDITYPNIRILLLTKLIFNKERKFREKNFTPLHCAAINNSKDLGKILISKGADINAKKRLITQK